MQQFTPPTEIVRARYVEFSGGVPEGLEATRDHVEGGAFDRWLAKVKADAWDEGARDYYNAPLGAVNPHRGRGDEQ